MISVGGMITAVDHNYEPSYARESTIPSLSSSIEHLYQFIVYASASARYRCIFSVKCLFSKKSSNFVFVSFQWLCVLSAKLYSLRTHTDFLTNTPYFTTIINYSPFHFYIGHFEDYPGPVVFVYKKGQSFRTTVVSVCCVTMPMSRSCLTVFELQYINVLEVYNLQNIGVNR